MRSVAQSCPTLLTLWTVGLQDPLSMGFSRHEYWSGLPFPSPGDLSNSGIEPTSPVSPALAAGSYYCTTWKANALIRRFVIFFFGSFVPIGFFFQNNYSNMLLQEAVYNTLFKIVLLKCNIHVKYIDITYM